MRQDKPGLQVRLTTGYRDEVVERTRFDETGMIWLHKPCPPDKLTAVISQCLHGK